MKFLKGITDGVVNGSWKKLLNPTVSRGKTAWPKTQADLLNYGVRLDYDGEVTQDGEVYHKYQVQPNAGKIAAAMRDWRDKHGGTHAVITTVLIKKGGTREDVHEVIADAFDKA